MKKLVLSISMFLIAATTFAQSEVVTDSIPPISLDGYKNFNGFMLDMGSMIVAPPPLIAPQLYYQPYNNNTIANYNEIFRPNMTLTGTKYEIQAHCLGKEIISMELSK